MYFWSKSVTNRGMFKKYKIIETYDIGNFFM